MGPRFCKRGNQRRDRLNRHRGDASMGPRFCKRGNMKLAQEVGEQALKLQWGHAFVCVET